MAPPPSPCRSANIATAVALPHSTSASLPLQSLTRRSMPTPQAPPAPRTPPSLHQMHRGCRPHNLPLAPVLLGDDGRRRHLAACSQRDQRHALPPPPRRWCLPPPPLTDRVDSCSMGKRRHTPGRLPSVLLCAPGRPSAGAAHGHHHHGHRQPTPPSPHHSHSHRRLPPPAHPHLHPPPTLLRMRTRAGSQQQPPSQRTPYLAFLAHPPHPVEGVHVHAAWTGARRSSAVDSNHPTCNESRFFCVGAGGPR